MLKTITIANLMPNPFRQIDEYPIQREKVDALRDSIRTTGFWGTIVGREAGKKIEIAFGHHRLVALEEEYGPRKKVEVIVRKLTNEQMLQMMARENMEEYGTSAWVEMETIKAAVMAYADGDIQLPALPEKANKSTFYRAPGFSNLNAATQELQHPYTRAQVATLLGWTNTRSKGTEQPNRACTIAFRALELVERKYLSPKQCRGLTREQLRVLVESQWNIYRSHTQAAKIFTEKAEDLVALSRTGKQRNRRRPTTALRLTRTGCVKVAELQATTTGLMGWIICRARKCGEHSLVRAE